MLHRTIRSLWPAILSMVLLFGAPLAAQAPLDADAKELKAYTLTSAAMKQFVAATRAMMVAAKADPRFAEVAKLEAEIDALQEKEEITEADEARLEKLTAQLEAMEDKLPNVNMADANLKSLTDIENALKREPLMVNALASAGMSARDYAKFTLAFFQAAMIHGMQKSGLVKEVPKDLQATVNMDNVTFIAANEAEITALMAEFQAAAKK